MCACVRMCACVCVGVRVCAGEHLHGHDGMLDLEGEEVPRDALLQVLYLLCDPPLA